MSATESNTVDDQTAYETFVKLNPNAYHNGDWIVWKNGKQLKHIEDPEGKVTLASVLVGVSGPCFCRRHSTTTVLPMLDGWTHATPGDTSSPSKMSLAEFKREYCDTPLFTSTRKVEDGHLIVELTTKPGLPPTISDAMNDLLKGVVKDSTLEGV